MADGPVTPDFADVMHALARIQRLLVEPPQSTYRPRKTPDERVEEEVMQLYLAMHRLKSALKEGGSFRIPGIISGLRYALSEIPEHVLTPIEQEAAE